MSDQTIIGDKQRLPAQLIWPTIRRLPSLALLPKLFSSPVRISGSISPRLSVEWLEISLITLESRYWDLTLDTNLNPSGNNLYLVFDLPLYNWGASLRWDNYLSTIRQRHPTTLRTSSHAGGYLGCDTIG